MPLLLRWIRESSSDTRLSSQRYLWSQGEHLWKKGLVTVVTSTLLHESCVFRTGASVQALSALSLTIACEVPPATWPKFNGSGHRQLSEHPDQLRRMVDLFVHT